MRKHSITLSALAAAIIANIGWNAWQDYARSSALATDWFVVRSINIADGPAHADPAALYDRVIKKPFAGRWYAEVKRADDQTTICRGRDENHYAPSDALPKPGVSLFWLVERPCARELPPGQYYLEVNYEILPDGYPVKSYRAVSNLFTLK